MSQAGGSCHGLRSFATDDLPDLNLDRTPGIERVELRRDDDYFELWFNGVTVAALRSFDCQEVAEDMRDARRNKDDSSLVIYFERRFCEAGSMTGRTLNDARAVAAWLIINSVSEPLCPSRATPHLRFFIEPWRCWPSSKTRVTPRLGGRLDPHALVAPPLDTGRAVSLLQVVAYESDTTASRHARSAVLLGIRRQAPELVAPTPVSFDDESSTPAWGGSVQLEGGAGCVDPSATVNPSLSLSGFDGLAIVAVSALLTMKI